MPGKRTPPEGRTARHRTNAGDPAGATAQAGDPPEHERTADNDSEALTHLRARMHQDYTRRQQYGPLGRTL
ncbi:hypothetical protein [Streptomyces sioyaensis]|uniref:hypothetical protein n=1 Tax=Streptomyces sioyaensis TaxID=67364 RepID=UPI003D717824